MQIWCNRKSLSCMISTFNSNAHTFSCIIAVRIDIIVRLLQPAWSYIHAADRTHYPSFADRPMQLTSLMGIACNAFSSLKLTTTPLAWRYTPGWMWLKKKSESDAVYSKVEAPVVGSLRKNMYEKAFMYCKYAKKKRSIHITCEKITKLNRSHILTLKPKPELLP